MVPPRPARANVLHLILLFLIGLSWGFCFVLIKVAMNGGIDPLGYLFWWAFLAGIVLLAIGALRRFRPRLDWPHARYYLLMGAVRIAIANFLVITVQQMVPVGLMAVIMTTVPIFTYTLSLVGRLERFVVRRFAGIVLGFAGVVLIVGPRGSLADPALAFWVLLGFATPFLHSCCYILLSERFRPPESDSVGLAAGMFLAAAAMLLPTALALGRFHPLWPPFSTAELALLGHALLAGCHFYAIFELIRMAGATYMSQANFLAIGFGVVFGIIFFNEAHSVWVWAAMGLIVAGVALVAQRAAAARS
jgi:drug/metabolite transporter (DMT)-like permease